VIGIAASGSTPYVRAALDFARTRGARTALICCNPACRDAADIVVALDTGPEVLPGSTRLKAGTVTKMVLNMITTGALALSGYVYEGQMVGMRPINAKLRLRAIRIIAGIAEVAESRAAELLDAAAGSIPVAVITARLGLDVAAARQRLQTTGSLRAALEQPR
jgi:N-acetylmuramic acid 6-phosphate etherase